jgi:glycosyltransferase involved in cell wall biosynthesis
MRHKTGEKKLAMPRILYIQYTNPAAYPPIGHSSRILAHNDWKVLFLGIGALGGADDLRFLPHPNITIRQMPFCPGGWRQKLHYLRFFLWILGWSLCWRPQWVYVSDLLSCPIGVLLSFLPGIKVIKHEHDSPTVTSNSFFIRLCLVARKWLAHRAKMCILPNQQRVERFAAEMDKDHQVFCVWNCPAQEEISLPHISPDSDSLWLLYHGSIAPSRLPTTVLNALAMLPDAVKLRVIGYETVGNSGYVQQLQELACQLGLGKRVEFLEAMPRSELLEWCQKCDIGIAFMPQSSEDINLQYMVGASNKAFDYLACGLALLVCNLPDWEQMYVEPGYGLACNPNDPESIRATLYWFLEHPDEMRKMGEQGRQRIATEWNYQVQFAPVLKQMSV